jgi:hypothetical protein
MITNLTKHAAALVNRAKAFIATLLATEDGRFLVTEDGRPLVISASFSTPLTNQTKHGV